MARETHLLNISTITIGDQDLREIQLDDSIIELAADIAARGLLQPIGVHKLDTEHYQLRWGKRRLLAHRHLRRDTIEALIVDTADGEILGDALAENLHRRPLSLAEECHAVSVLTTSGRSPDQIASLTGKGRAWVLRRLTVPGLPLELRAHVLDGTLACGSAEELARLEDEAGRGCILTETLNKHWSATQVRAACEAWRSASVPTHTVAHDPPDPSCSQVAYPTLLRSCAACQRLRQPGDLILILVCRDGCPPLQPADPALLPPNGDGPP